MSTRTLREYHERTKHSYESIRRSGGGLDWSNEPSPFKEYLDLAAVRLPVPAPTGVAALDAIARSAAGDGGAALTAETLSHLLFHAGAVTRIVRGSFGEIRFRAYASAGALYPNELYVVAGPAVEGLEAGVYHYGPRDHDLRRLRGGDVRGALGLSGRSPGAASIVVSGIPWRTAWKYGARGFRHLYWDAGMVVANLLAAAAACDVRAGLLLGFVDDDAGRVIGVDGSTEFPLCVVTLGDGEAPAPADVEEIDLAVAPLSRRPQRDRHIEEAYTASKLARAKDVERFRSAPGRGDDRTDPPPSVRELDALPLERLSRDPFERVVRRRGSSRHLAREPMPAAELAALLNLASGGVAGDWRTGDMHAFLVASALEGLSPGAYRYDGGGRFAEIRSGDLRRKAGFVCLEQRLGADAAAVLFLTADVDARLEALGPRGYAASQLEAAIVAGRLYLAAYAQCLGASGITFYDDEAKLLFETSEEPMLAVVLGPEGQRESLIRCRERVRPG